MALLPKDTIDQRYPDCNTLAFCDTTGAYDEDTNPGGYGGGGNPSMDEITQTKFVFTSPGSDISISIDKGFLPADECIDITYNDYLQNAPEVCEYDTEFATYGISASILINTQSYVLGAVASFSALLTALNNLNKGVWSQTSATKIEVVGGYNYSTLTIAGSAYAPSCPPASDDDPCHTCGESDNDTINTQSEGAFVDGCWQITYELYTALVTGTYDLTAASYGGAFTVEINGVSNSLGTIASVGALITALNGLGVGTWENSSGIITVTGNYIYGDIVGAATFTPEIETLGNALYASTTKNFFLSCQVTKRWVDLLMQRMRNPNCCNDCDDGSDIDDNLCRINTDFQTMMVVAKTNPCNCDTAGSLLTKVNKSITNVMANCIE